jgi:hypothetical protein
VRKRKLRMPGTKKTQELINLLESEAMQMQSVLLNPWRHRKSELVSDHSELVQRVIAWVFLAAGGELKRFIDL